MVKLNLNIFGFVALWGALSVLGGLTVGLARAQSVVEVAPKIEEYLRSYEQIAARKKEPSSEVELQEETLRLMESHARRVIDVRAGDALYQRLFYRAYALADHVAYQGEQPFNDLVAYLVPYYYATIGTPRGDALYQLLSRISDLTQEQAHRYVDDRLVKDATTATMVAWMVMGVVELRGGRRGVLDDLRRGRDFFIRRQGEKLAAQGEARGASVGGFEVGRLASKSGASSGAVVPAAGGPGGGSGARAEEAVQTGLAKVQELSQTPVQSRSRRLVDGARKYFVALGKAFVFGGAYAGIRVLSESQPVKMDPRPLLDFVQAHAIDDLELEVGELEAEIERAFGGAMLAADDQSFVRLLFGNAPDSLSKSKRAEAANAAALRLNHVIQKLEVLSAREQHLRKFAPTEYQGNRRLPELGSDPWASVARLGAFEFRKPWTGSDFVRVMNRDERFRARTDAEVRRSTALSTMVRQLALLRAERKKQLGLQPADQVYVSLDDAKLGLDVVRSFLLRVNMLLMASSAVSAPPAPASKQER